MRARGEPVLRDDRVEITVADLGVEGARVRVGRVQVAASPSVFAGGAAVPPLDLPRVTVIARGGGTAGDAPTRLEARADLPRGGRVTATGDARLGAPSAELTVA